MLELLPRNVGYAVAQTFQYRYSLSSTDFEASTVTCSGHDAMLHSTTLQPPLVLIACDSAFECSNRFWLDLYDNKVRTS